MLRLTCHVNLGRNCYVLSITTLLHNATQLSICIHQFYVLVGHGSCSTVVKRRTRLCTLTICSPAHFNYLLTGHTNFAFSLFTLIFAGNGKLFSLHFLDGAKGGRYIVLPNFCLQINLKFKEKIHYWFWLLYL